ncbi:GNAT family N-acetyltransferase [Naasia lichenicola]|uniref:GNAT family N-acetyltransferase n=1 Tax=Naasia lichenicola TaxID=2565933 RepID=A0A4S4FSU8_9MICO|nr:GNAT family N-acetyltransferase [Naasia lichenicola]THG33388.1 GNAT family N-acetyltransferase [Naasia lichenicola]
MIERDRADGPELILRPWSDGDLGLLRRINAPEMTAHLGGPETEEKLLARHARYVGIEAAGESHMWRIDRLTDPGAADLGAADARSVGSIGIWPSDWQGDPGWETGWSILPEFQGQGLASAAAREVVRRARGFARFEWLYAFPGVGNVPSNAVCRSAGFEKVGEEDVEYPKGSLMRAGVWRIRVG